AVEREIRRRLPSAPEGSAAPASIERNGAIVLTKSLEEAASVVNCIGPEHVEVVAENAGSIADLVTNCGAVFVGSLAGVALGDYSAGPNHVLPTGGSSRFFSVLGVYDFCRRRNVSRISPEYLAAIGAAAEELALFEGLPLHAGSVRERLEAVVPKEVTR
ncbi:MAG: histidinol dehydrogenase, partial [Thermoanaerobaculia bacterium]